MTRLIDADAFLERIKKDPLFPLVEKYGLSGVIEAEPTVEAISVQFIRDQIKHYDDERMFDCAGVLDCLIEDYVKENEHEIDAEPVKHGHWIMYPYSLEFDESCSEDDVVCSVCEKQVELIALSMAKLYRYCPCCGAKMDEVKEE